MYRGTVVTGSAFGRVPGLLPIAVVIAMSLPATPLAAAESDVLRATLDDARHSIQDLQRELAEVDPGRVIWQSDPEVVVLRAKLEAAGRQIERLTLGERNANAQITAARGKLEASAAKIHALVQQKDAASAEIVSLKDKLASAREDTERLETILANAKVSRASVEAWLAAEAGGRRHGQEDTQQVVTDAAVLHKKVERWKQRTWYLVAKKEAVESERDELSQKCELVQQQADRLDGAVKNALADRARRDKQVQDEFAEAERREAKLNRLANSCERARDAAVDEVAAANAASKARDEELWHTGRAVEKLTIEAKVLRQQLAVKQKLLDDMELKIAKAVTDVRIASDKTSERIQKMIEVAFGQPAADTIRLEEKLAAANEEIARLKAKLGHKSTAAASR